MRKLVLTLWACFSLTQLQCEDITWSSPPTLLSSVMGNASDPQVGIDSSGNVVSIWVEDGFVNATALLFGGTWDTPTIISNTSTSKPRLVVDPSGNATAIWLEGTALKAAQKNFGGSWGSGTTLDTSGASEPELSIDASGNVVAIWNDGGLIKSRTKLFGGSWGTTNTLSAAGADSPQVTIGANGQVIAVWHGLLSMVDTIFSSAKTLVGGVWSAATAISSPAHKSANPSVAVDNSGNALATWYIYTQVGDTFTDVYLQSAAKPSGGSWSVPILVTNTIGFYDPSKLEARLGFDSTGNAVVVWSTSADGSTFDILSTTLQTGGDGTWTTPETQLVQTNNNALSFDLKIPSARDAFASLMLFDGTNIIVEATVSNIDAYQQNLWAIPDLLSDGTNNGFPKIAASISGSNIYTASVWLQNDSNNTVQASVGTGMVLQPPTGLSVMQSFNNFGIFVEYYNTLSWTPSVSPDIIGYIIFRNGLLIAQVDGSTTQYIDGNREQNASVTYGIASLDSKGTQSAVTTVTFP